MGNAFTSTALPAMSLARAAPGDAGAMLTARALIWRGAGMIAATASYAPLVKACGRRGVLVLVLALCCCAAAATFLEFTMVPYIAGIPFACFSAGLVGGV